MINSNGFKLKYVNYIIQNNIYYKGIKIKERFKNLAQQNIK